MEKWKSGKVEKWKTDNIEFNQKANNLSQKTNI